MFVKNSKQMYLCTHNLKIYLFMKTLVVCLFLSCSLITFTSCEKDNDIAPISDSGSKEHYMPLSKGNSWTYDSNHYGEYTISVTGNKKINNKEYFVLTNTLTPNVEGYYRYQGNKLYSYSSVNGSYIEFLFVDEDAAESQEWIAGNIPQSQPDMYSYVVRYTCKFVKFHQTYTFEDKTYSDVMEINLKTTIENFVFGNYYTSFFNASQLEEFRANFESTFALSAINQTQYYAKGIGYVNQVSEDMPALNATLIDYSIK